MIDWDGLVLAPLMGVFGETVRPIYTPVIAGGAPYGIDGVFDRAYHEVTLLDDASSANTLSPCLGVRLAQFAAEPQPGDTVYIASVDLTFVIRDVRPDGHGSAKLMLMLSA
jgi:hypothetical protein